MYARGCTAVGVDESCRQAGVHKGSFSHFFPSKQALILAVLAMYGQHIRDLWEAGRLPACPLRERCPRAFAHD
jgi:AcrR family transcriptional regulator